MFRFASMQSAKCFRRVVRFFFQEQTNELWTPSCPSKPFALPFHTFHGFGRFPEQSVPLLQFKFKATPKLFFEESSPEPQKIQKY